MTEDRKAIVRGVLSCVRICNKMWKLSGTEVDLVLRFGIEDGITEKEIQELLKEAA